MCLISIAGKGTDKYSEKFLDALRTAAETNKDGMGYSFKRASTKKVYISKGYSSVDGLIRSLRSHRLKENDELMVHQRIGNKGAKNIDMCHPFVLGSTKDLILQNDTYVTFPTMVHNGTFFSYSKTNSEFSDTFWFVLEFIHRPELLMLMKNDHTFFNTTFRDKISTNRLCFLFPEEETSLITFGDYKEDDGYLFSNESYKDKSIRNVGGVNSNVTTGGSEERFLCGPHNSWENNDEDQEDYTDYAIESYKSFRNIKDEDYKGTQLQIALKAGTSSPSPANDDIIVSGSATAFDCPATGIKHKLYMDMWIPNKHVKDKNQYGSIRWNPTIFNYNELTLQALSTQEDEGIQIDTYYQIINFDNSSSRGDSEGLHAIRRKYSRGGKKEEILYVPGYRIPQIFKITPSTEVTSKYIWYYRLCRAFSPSKTLLRRVDNLMDVHKVNKSNTIDLKSIKNIPVEAMLMFQWMLTKQMNPNTYLEEINKTNYVAI